MENAENVLLINYAHCYFIRDHERDDNFTITIRAELSCEIK